MLLAIVHTRILAALVPVKHAAHVQVPVVAAAVGWDRIGSTATCRRWSKRSPAEFTGL